MHGSCATANPANAYTPPATTERVSGTRPRRWSCGRVSHAPARLPLLHLLLIFPRYRLLVAQGLLEGANTRHRASSPATSPTNTNN